MPSVLVSPISGGSLLYSGSPWSGQGYPHPVGSVQLRLSPDASGNVYVGLSGGVTITSGGIFSSGMSGGLMDGMVLTPGDPYTIPKLGFPTVNSGKLSVWVTCDAVCSGQARLYWEVF